LRTAVPLGGFPWGQLAQSQRGALWLLAIAGIGGSWLVAFLLAAVNALAAEAWEAGRRRAWRTAAIGVAIAVLLVGLAALAPSTRSPADEATPRVAIVQGNVPRDFEGDLYQKELQIIASHRKLTEALEPGSVDLVVWPESAVGIDLEEEERAGRAVASAARSVDAPMIVGGNLDVGVDRYKVMAFHVSAEGAIVDRYQKTHLVPFGEYVPARSALDWLPMLDQVPRDAIPADAETIFDIAGIPVAPIISFEGDFGSLARRRIDAGGRLLVVATNTSTWEESWASAQHVAFSQVRAAENGVWVVHAALSGISAFIAPDGRIVESTPLWEATSAVREVGVAASPTFYARTGDWLPLVCLGTAIVLAGWSLVRRRREMSTG
ncbi:MAG: apolipoprotein N-acyltransferase, partial [Actinomycetota bacterium]|nr:apolipoprotein N-acyltransferase [Actinomycetota bacterium]